MKYLLLTLLFTNYIFAYDAKQSAIALSMSLKDYSFSMAIIGLSTGLIFLFLMSLIAIKIGSR